MTLNRNDGTFARMRPASSSEANGVLY